MRKMIFYAHNFVSYDSLFFTLLSRGGLLNLEMPDFFESCDPVGKLKFSE